MSSARSLISAASARHGLEALHPSGFASLEALEPRALLTTYTYIHAVDAFHLESLVRPIEAPGGAASFGAVVAQLGDIDDDGSPDFAVAAPGALNGDGRYAGDEGSVFLYSGRTLALIRTLSDGAPGFGAAMVSLGDIDADGVPDLAIGSPSADTNADASLDFFGRVAVYSGADGSVLWSRSGDSRLDELGWAVARAGDVNHDDITDLIVGAPGGGGDALNPGAGKAFVLSGADGAVVNSFTGESNGDRFGSAVDGGVDVPALPSFEAGDGFFDFLVGAPARNAGAGAAYLINGSDGSFRYTFTEGPDAATGTAVAFVGMTSNPSFPVDFLLRLAVGSPGYNSGAGRVTLHTAGDFNNGGVPGLEPGARLGSRIYTLDIIDSTSQSNYFVVTAPAAASGDTLYVLPGNTTNSFPVTGQQTPHAAWLTAIGDADADGNIDFVGGYASTSGPGAARVFPYALAARHFAPGSWIASDNALNFVISTTSVPFSFPGFEGSTFQGFVVLNGQIIPRGLIPGLPADAILQGINNSGMLFGYQGAMLPSGFRTLESQFFLQDGLFVTLANAITSFVGAHPTGVSLVKLGNNGDAIFSGFTAGADGVSTDGVPRTYLFRNGVLTELWHGSILDINSSGAIVGVSGDIGPVLRTPDGTVAAFANFTPRFVRDDASVVGVIDGGSLHPRLGVWRHGVTTVLSPQINPSEDATSAFWFLAAADNNGRILARFEWTVPFSGRPPSVNPHLNYLYTPESAFQIVDDVVSGATGEVQIYTSRLLDTGSGLIDGVALLPVAGSGLPDIHGAPPSSATAGPTGLFLTVLDQNGNAIYLRRDGIRFAGETLTFDHNDFGDAESAITYVDARDHRTYAVVRTSTNLLLWFRQRTDTTFRDPIAITVPGFTQPIVGPLSTFTSIDGRVHITGVGADGHVLIYFQNNTFAAPDSLQNWGFDDLSQHASRQGQPIPQFTDHTELVGYTNPWGGMNIAGVNTQHEIEVMWWAPGQGLWSHDNLSQSADTPTLADDARLAVFIAPWGGMHLGAIDAAGHLQSTWWAPGLAHWEHNDLTAEFDGPHLAPDSLTAYVTDWGGLNVAGLDVDTGAAKVYWWTPTTGAWITEALDLGDGAPVLTGRLESAAHANNLNIFATTTGGDVLRLYWYPSQADSWVIEDVAASLA